MSDDFKSHTVIIPIPAPFQRNYGVHASTAHDADRQTQRYNAADIALIRKQAARIQVTVSAFIKESAVNMAKALEIQEKSHAHEKHDLRDRR